MVIRMSDDRLRREYAEQLKQSYLQSGFKQGFEAGYAKAKEDFERPQWIPCSERLPNDDDYKPYLNYTEAVWFCTSDGAIGIGWYYKSTNEWEAFGDIVLRDKVVAWMPLPEPYKKEGEVDAKNPGNR